MEFRLLNLNQAISLVSRGFYIISWNTKPPIANLCNFKFIKNMLNCPYSIRTLEPICELSSTYSCNYYVKFPPSHTYIIASHAHTTPIFKSEGLVVPAIKKHSIDHISIVCCFSIVKAWAGVILCCTTRSIATHYKSSGFINIARVSQDTVLF